MTPAADDDQNLLDSELLKVAGVRSGQQQATGGSSDISEDEISDVNDEVDDWSDGCVLVAVCSV